VGFSGGLIALVVFFFVAFYQFAHDPIDLTGITFGEDGPVAKPIITTSTLPDGQVAVFYEHTLLVTEWARACDFSCWHWSIIERPGNLPNGLLLDPFTGVISGEPIRVGTFNFQVQVNDYNNSISGRKALKAMSITILPESAGVGED
jgi:hypothetical protein